MVRGEDVVKLAGAGRMRYSLAEVAGASLQAPRATAVDGLESCSEPANQQGPLDGFCICIIVVHMTTIDQRDLDLCAVQKSEEWEVLSVRSTPQSRTLPTDRFRDTTPAVYLP